MWFKGIIMDIKDDYAIVMKSDSSMAKVKLKENMSVGDALIFIEEDLYESKEIVKTAKNNKNKFLVTALSIAAALALVILPMFNSMASRAYAVVSLDINPSIQFELDKNKRIVGISALNQDGANLDISEIKGLTIEEGLEKLKDKLGTNGYKVVDDKILVGFAFLTNKENVAYEKEVKDTVNNQLKGAKLIYLKGNKANSKAASEKGISLGRYEANLILDDDRLEDKIESMSVEEILNLLNSKSIYLDEELKEELKDALDDKLEDKYDNDIDDGIDDNSDEIDDNDDDYEKYDSDNDDDKDDDDDEIEYDENDDDE